MENSFTVLPMSQRIKLEPGKTYNGKVSVAIPVDAKNDFHYIATVTPYSVVGKEYTADLAAATNYTQITKWITIKEPTGTIPANGVKDIEFTITVPENAPGGGQYATIAISSNPDASQTGGTNVDTIHELASIVYGEVAGDIIHDGDILENNVPGFVTDIPIAVSAMLSNNGNMHEDATFVLSVKNNITGETIYPQKDKDGAYTELVMPESTRFINREIQNLPNVGIVHVSQTIYYNGKYSAIEKDVIICPIWLLFIMAFVIIAIIGGIFYKIRSIKKKKAAPAAA